jgi:flagellar biosynthesis protein FlhG
VSFNFGRTSRVVSITSGKGGVGKTSVAVNLSIALARSGKRTLLADCDLGLANAALLLGVNPAVTIDDVIEGRLSPDEVIIEGPHDLHLLPGGSGIGSIREFDAATRQKLSNGLRPWSRMTDFVIVDTPTGASDATLEMVATADQVLLVLSSEPTAFMDAYATVKMLTLEYGVTGISVIANMVQNGAEGRILFSRFHEVVSRFLPTQLDLLGSVPADPHMREAVMHKKACVDAYPQAHASAAFSRLAATLSDRSIAASPNGSRFFGMEVRHAVR